MDIVLYYREGCHSKNGQRGRNDDQQRSEDGQGTKNCRGHDCHLLSRTPRHQAWAVPGMRGTAELCPPTPQAVPLSGRQDHMCEMSRPLLQAGNAITDPDRHALRWSPDALPAPHYDPAAHVGWSPPRTHPPSTGADDWSRWAQEGKDINSAPSHGEPAL
jgi:hypothetical protein